MSDKEEVNNYVEDLKQGMIFCKEDPEAFVVHIMFFKSLVGEFLKRKGLEDEFDKFSSEEYQKRGIDFNILNAEDFEVENNEGRNY